MLAKLTKVLPKIESVISNMLRSTAVARKPRMKLSRQGSERFCVIAPKQKVLRAEHPISFHLKLSEVDNRPPEHKKPSRENSRASRITSSISTFSSVNPPRLVIILTHHQLQHIIVSILLIIILLFLIPNKVIPLLALSQAWKPPYTIPASEQKRPLTSNAR